jgi:unconventional prefoldin RPB5 interactor 1
MAQTLKDSFLDLERHRKLLEENIEKLRKSLWHWQTWEAEYEGLKEEILAAKPTPTQEQLSAICREYEGELVTRKGVEEILGSRSAAQVVNLLDRRIDYVEQNVQTVQKQIEAAENKLAVATVISTPDVRNEEGLPMTEIIEELDEEGNVISSHTSTPGSAKPQLLEVLKKAGVDVPANLTPTDSAKPSEGKPLASPEQDASNTKKGVTFTEDTKSGPEPEKSQTAKRLEGIMNIAKQQDAKPSEPPVIPVDESPEDAALRREMLQYGMSEVGAVVAELDLEDGSDWTDDDYDQEDSSSTGDEDEFGRSTSRVVDDEIRRQMIELEQRLGVRMMENIGKKASDYDVVKEGIGRVTINGQENSAAIEDSTVAMEKKSSRRDSSPAATSTRKSVRFSEELDISPAPKLPATVTPVARKTTAPVNDIVERTTLAQSTSVPSQPKKTSRFKSARTTIPLEFSPVKNQTRTVPTGPEGTTLAPSVVEREIPQDSVPAEPDELDPHLLHQEVATEYHKMRNMMIQRQGGFMKEEESEIVPFTEEEGGPKKMSRFKAARLARN